MRRPDDYRSGWAADRARARLSLVMAFHRPLRDESYRRARSDDDRLRDYRSQSAWFARTLPFRWTVGRQHRYAPRRPDSGEVSRIAHADDFLTVSKGYERDLRARGQALGGHASASRLPARNPRRPTHPRARRSNSRSQRGEALIQDGLHSLPRGARHLSRARLRQPERHRLVLEHGEIFESWKPPSGAAGLGGRYRTSMTGSTNLETTVHQSRRDFTPQVPAHARWVARARIGLSARFTFPPA